VLLTATSSSSRVVYVIDSSYVIVAKATNVYIPSAAVAAGGEDCRRISSDYQNDSLIADDD